jgi:hypothetical protein
MGCQEMKEKKKESLKKTKDPEKDEKEKEGNEKGEDNPENKEDQKSSKEQNIIELEQQNSPIKEDDQKFRSIKEQDIKEDEKVESLLQLSDEPYIPNYIGKLCYDPLDLFVYDTKKRIFHIQKFRHEENPNFEKLTNSSSCCNGDNKLFISGGIDNDEVVVDKLWIFDLIDYKVECLSNFAPKNNHSMIYIPSKYIFSVGGNDFKVFYYDIYEKNVESWGELNKKRIEPALIQMNNYLYVFDNVNRNENYLDLTFERTDLLSDKPHFELIEPNLSQNLRGNIIPKFFGVAKENEESIIFLGGNILDEQNDINGDKNYRYNVKENKIELSDVPFVNVQLKEKTFLNFNRKDDIYFILPDFYRKCPQVCFYIKNQNRLKVVEYKPEINSSKNERVEENNNLLKVENFNFNSKIKSYNFNMPKNKENISNNIINNQ